MGKLWSTIGPKRVASSSTSGNRTSRAALSRQPNSHGAVGNEEITNMSRPMERTVLETGLKLDVNQLLRDGVLQPGKVTEPSDHCWFNDDGQQIAHARIGSNMTMTGTGTMRVAAYLDRQTQSYRTCSDGQRRSCHWRALNSSDPLFGRLQNVSAALRYG